MERYCFLNSFARKKMIIVLADDLTGAADTGVQFLQANKPAYMLRATELGHVSFDTLPDVLSVYTRSRSMKGKAA